MWNVFIENHDLFPSESSLLVDVTCHVLIVSLFFCFVLFFISKKTCQDNTNEKTWHVLIHRVMWRWLCAPSSLLLGSSPGPGPLQPISLPCRLFALLFCQQLPHCQAFPFLVEWREHCIRRRHYFTQKMVEAVLLRHEGVDCFSCIRLHQLSVYELFVWNSFFILLFSTFLCSFIYEVFPSLKPLSFIWSILSTYFILFSFCLQSFNQKLNFTLGHNSYMLKCTNVMCPAYSGFEKWLRHATHTSIKIKNFLATSFVHWVCWLMVLGAFLFFSLQSEPLNPICLSSSGSFKQKLFKTTLKKMRV